MAQWAAFAGLVVLTVSLFLALARASQAMVSDGAGPDDDAPSAPGFDDRADNPPVDEPPLGSDSIDAASFSGDATDGPGVDHDERTDRTDRPDGDTDDPDTDDARGESSGDSEASPPSTDSMPTSALLLNVALSQGIFGGLVLVGAWYTEIPPAALGVSGIEIGPLALGIGMGIALYAGNAFAAAGADALGFSAPDDLRATLAPDSVGGWLLLLLLILPAIAFVEELLFRAALIGAISAGFAISPWALAIISSIAFALGHGAQGLLGMLVTGSLGFVLATAFVLTGSLLVVVIAHYLVNALEFVVHEGLGIEWSE